MDITNRIVKICRRIEEIEYALACGDTPIQKGIEFEEELDSLESELKTLQPAT